MFSILLTDSGCLLRVTRCNSVEFGAIFSTHFGSVNVGYTRHLAIKQLTFVSFTIAPASKLKTENSIFFLHSAGSRISMPNRLKNMRQVY